MKNLSEIFSALTHEVGVHLNQAIGIFELFFADYAETKRLFTIYIKHNDCQAIMAFRLFLFQFMQMKR